ncbi:MAG: hypothetical protein KF851_10840 [Pirellulaceae bacterium]|nr:hypothetical protein [Pirellulaceae bacterium]
MSRIVVALTFIIAGLLGLLIGTYVAESSKFWGVFLDHLAAAFIVVGLISISEKFLAEKEHTRQLLKYLNIHESVHHSGLHRSYIGADNADYTNIILKSKNLAIVFNDGKTWIGDRKFELLRQRLRNKSTITEVFLLRPEEEILKSIAQKTCVDGSTLEDEIERTKEKINETVRSLKSLQKESEHHGKLSIRFILYYPMYTLCLGDDEGIVSLYTTSSWKTREIPVLEIKKTDSNKSLYNFLKDDIERLRAQSDSIE